ncbi:hypothetical protein GCM10027400_09540 [Pseudoxanthomonas daejeonensis]
MGGQVADALDDPGKHQRASGKTTRQWPAADRKRACRATERANLGSFMCVFRVRAAKNVPGHERPPGTGRAAASSFIRTLGRDLGHATTVGSGIGPDLLTSRRGGKPASGALAGSRRPLHRNWRLPPVGNSTPP